jgi:hypothetical protein
MMKKALCLAVAILGFFTFCIGCGGEGRGGEGRGKGRRRLVPDVYDRRSQERPEKIRNLSFMSLQIFSEELKFLVA